jgi:hypothetical protein
VAIIKLLPPAKNICTTISLTLGWARHFGPQIERQRKLDHVQKVRALPKKWVPENRTIFVPKVGPLQVVHMISHYSDFGDPKMEPKRYLILGTAFQAFARTRFKQSGSTS